MNKYNLEDFTPTPLSIKEPASFDDTGAFPEYFINLLHPDNCDTLPPQIKLRLEWYASMLLEENDVSIDEVLLSARLHITQTISHLAVFLKIGLTSKENGVNITADTESICRESGCYEACLVYLGKELYSRIKGKL